MESFVNNAKRFLETKDEFGTFDKYIWQFVSYKTVVNRYRNWDEIPATSRESEEMGRGLKKRGFIFVGPTICYAFMQSVGMFSDHVVMCFRQRTVRGLILCLLWSCLEDRHHEKNQVKSLAFISADRIRGAICEQKVCAVILMKKLVSCTLQTAEIKNSL